MGAATQQPPSAVATSSSPATNPQKKSGVDSLPASNEEAVSSSNSSRTIVVVNERSPLLATNSLDGGVRLPPRTLAVVNDTTPLPEGEGILIDTTTGTNGSLNGKRGGIWFDYSSSEAIFLIRRPPTWMPEVMHFALDLRVLVVCTWITASAGLTGAALAAILRARSETHDTADQVLEFAWSVGKVTASLALAFGLGSLFMCITWIVLYRLNYPRRLGHPFLFTTVLAVCSIVPVSLGQWCLALWFFLHVPVALLVLLLRLRFQLVKATQPMSNEA